MVDRSSLRSTAAMSQAEDSPLDRSKSNLVRGFWRWSKLPERVCRILIMPGRRWPGSATKDTRVFRTHGFALFFYSLPLFQPPSAILPPNGSALSHPILFSSVLSRIRELVGFLTSPRGIRRIFRSQE